MTKVYFVRHAKPDFSVHDDLTRPLTEEGLIGSKKVTEFLKDKHITKVYSSPYKRAMDTVSDFAKNSGLDIHIIDDFRERKIGGEWIDDFHSYAKRQWSTFDYKLAEGESLGEVQRRNISALNNILEVAKNENIVIGTHGTALGTIINYFDKKFDYEQFERIIDLMPFIVCVEFDGTTALKIQEFNFEGQA